MRRRLRAAGALTGWLAFLVATVAALHAMGHRLGPPPLSSPGAARAWLDQQQPAEAVFCLFRLLALALGWYLLVATVAAVLARLSRRAALVRVVDLVTLPGVRRLVNAAVGLSLVTAAHPGLAWAGSTEPGSTEPPPAVTMHRLPDPPAQPPTTPQTTTPPTTTPTTTTPITQAPAPTQPGGPAPAVTMHRLPDAAPAAPSPPPAAQPPPAPPSRPEAQPGPAPETVAPSAAPSIPGWVVRPGDHFWAVAERALVGAWGRPVTDAEVGRYWRTLVEANRSRLHDPHNPDLLFPGQALTVPPPPARPG